MFTSNMLNYFQGCILVLLFSFLGQESHITKNPITSSKYFEGTITYTHSSINKTHKYDAATLKLITGTYSVLSFKDGDYVAKSYGSITSSMLYLKKQNKWYREKIT